MKPIDEDHADLMLMRRQEDDLAEREQAKQRMEAAANRKRLDALRDLNDAAYAAIRAVAHSLSGEDRKALLEVGRLSDRLFEDEALRQRNKGD